MIRPSAFRVVSLLAVALAVGACGDPNAGGGRGFLGGASGPQGDTGAATVPSASGGPGEGLIGADGQPIGAGVGTVGTEGTPLPTGSDAAPTVTAGLGAGDDQVIIDGMVVPIDGSGSTGTPSEEAGEVVDIVNLPEEADPVTTTDVFLGSRIRRLTNAEYGNTIFDLFGVTVDTSLLPADSRQNDFTRNADQAVDPVLGGHLQRVAQEVAASVVANGLSALVPCASSGDQACARTFLEDFGSRIYRRPLESAEIDSLLSLYDAGAEGQTSTFQGGMEVVLQAMLQSASFLYLSEIGGEAVPGEITLLDPWELAASLSYLLTGHPPDDELIAAAGDSSLLEPAVRQAQAERLLQTPGAEAQIRGFIKEWLKLDSVSTVDKSDERFTDLRGPVEDEANQFISAIAVNGDGRLSTMLTAGYTYVGPEMASFYGVQADASGRADLTGTGRVGLLQLAGFLAANAQNDESGPIKRGVAVLRKVLCYELPDPSQVDDPLVQNVMPPPRDETLTTRERFAAHSNNAACVGCHNAIDSIGFTFENFDAIGDLRTTDHDKPVDTSGALTLGLASDGPVADSVELSAKLAQEPRVAECFARHVYRNGMANNSGEAEATFMRGLGDPAAITDDVKALLTALSGSNSFLLRVTPTAAEQL